MPSRTYSYILKIIFINKVVPIIIQKRTIYKKNNNKINGRIFLVLYFIYNFLRVFVHFLYLLKIS